MGTEATQRKILSTLHPSTILKANPDPNTHPNPQPSPNPTPTPTPRPRPGPSPNQEPNIGTELVGEGTLAMTSEGHQG